MTLPYDKIYCSSRVEIWNKIPKLHVNSGIRRYFIDIKFHLCYIAVAPEIGVH